MKTADLANEFALLREFLLRKTEPSEKHKGYRVCPLCSKNKLRLGIKDWQCLTGQCHEQHRGDLLGLVQASGWREELNTEASNGNVKPSGRPKATTSTNGTTKHTSKPFESFKAVVEWAKSKANQVIVYDYDAGHKVLRLEKAEGEKEFRPVHLGDGGWYISKGDNPWPLLITREPVEGDILVITEGEKAAQAITATRGRYVGVCSQGGSNGVKGTDWATLPQGFHVVVWPDADGPGEKYAKAVAERIPGALLVDVSGQPDKWDAADLVGARYINGQIELGMKATEADALVHKFIEGRARQTEEIQENSGLNSDISEERSISRCTELSNADRLLDRHGEDIRFVIDADSFLIWAGTHWKFDSRSRSVVRSMMSRVSRWISNESSAEPEENESRNLRRWAIESEKKSVINASADLMATRQRIWVERKQLDSHHELLNCPNGTINLRTGEIRPHNRSDLITCITRVNYVPGYENELWTSTVEKFIPKAEVRRYVQKLIGYGLTGYATEKAFPILWGGGNNGKGSIFETIAKSALGDSYAVAMNPDGILAGDKKESSDRVNVQLVGKRLVLVEETADGDMLNSRAVKSLASGGDVMSARPLFKEAFNFHSTHTVLLMTNAEPRVDCFDAAMKSRIKFIHFGVTVEANGRIRHQLETDVEVHKAALAWAVEGAKLFLAEGLAEEPKEIREATERYFTGQDLIGQFLAECFTIAEPGNEDYSETKQAIYLRYKSWAEDQGLKRPLSKIALGKKLTEKGFTNIGGVRVAEYSGLSLERG